MIPLVGTFNNKALLEGALCKLSRYFVGTRSNCIVAPRQVLDNILGSAAYDSRIRPPGSNSTRKLNQIFCHRHLATWSWKQCEAGKANDTDFSENKEDKISKSVY